MDGNVIALRMQSFRDLSANALGRTGNKGCVHPCIVVAVIYHYGYMSPLQSLPPASTEEIQRSQLLVEKIRSVIKASPNESIGFDTFMALCLYEPGLGYYSGPSQKFGLHGDFVTAPMQSPLFGACIGQQCAQWLGQLEINEGILEFGAGDGLLAAQVLNELSRQGQEVAYAIVELSADLQTRQRTTIATLAPQALDRVVWLDQLPSSFKGIVLGNELIDAMPVRLFRFEQNVSRQLEKFERRVIAGPSDGAPFAWKDVAADPQLQQDIDMALARANWGPERVAGYLSELPSQANAWITSVAQCLEQGVILLLDYGFSAQEFYHPQRSQGTLNCHYRHHSHGEPFYLPGLQDITAHVDFSALLDEAFANGLELLGYTNQAHFLMNLQMLEKLKSLTTSPQYPLHAQAVGRLLSEAEMGDLFKAIAFAKLDSGRVFRSTGFSHGDKSHTL
jgi:SAM-dependent MidA family methyltransferase